MHCKHRCKARWRTCVKCATDKDADSRQKADLHFRQRGNPKPKFWLSSPGGAPHHVGLADYVVTWHWHGLSRVKIITIGIRVLKKRGNVCTLLLTQRLEKATVSQLVRYPWETRLYMELWRWTVAHFADALLCSKRGLKSWSQCSAPLLSQGSCHIKRTEWRLKCAGIINRRRQITEPQVSWSWWFSLISLLLLPMSCDARNSKLRALLWPEQQIT